MEIFKNDGMIEEDVADALYELGNVGVGMASVTIGKITGVRVHIGTPSVVPVDKKIEDMVDIANDTEKEEIGILMNFVDTMQGVVLFVLNEDFVSFAIEKMTGEKYSGKQFLEDEDCLSAIQEFSNMMAAGYVKAIGKYTGIRIYMSPVMVDRDVPEAILSNTLNYLAKSCKAAICIDTKFSILENENDDITDAGRVIMLPDDDSVKKLVEAMGL